MLTIYTAGAIGRAAAVLEWGEHVTSQAWDVPEADGIRSELVACTNALYRLTRPVQQPVFVIVRRPEVARLMTKGTAHGDLLNVLWVAEMERTRGPITYAHNPAHPHSLEALRLARTAAALAA